jgi:hypothetical protein
VANREVGGLVTREIGGRGTRRQVGVQGRQWAEVDKLERWTLAEPGWLRTASGVREASMAGVNLEGRDFMNWHGSP